MDSIPFATPGSIFDKIDSVAAYASLSDEERHEYDMNLQAYRDYVNSIDFAEKKGEERGMKIGQERGMKIGQERGMKIGEEREMRRLILSMYHSGMDPASISKIAGLSVANIQTILSNPQE